MKATATLFVLLVVFAHFGASSTTTTTGTSATSGTSGETTSGTTSGSTGSTTSGTSGTSGTTGTTGSSTGGTTGSSTTGTGATTGTAATTGTDSTTGTGTDSTTGTGTGTSGTASSTTGTTGPLSGTIGVDISGDDCNGMSQSKWSCLVNSGYTFAIIQAWQGGNKYTSNIATCVSQARSAGMSYVDVYVFMCPQCYGNSDPATVVNTVVNNLHSAGVSYGMIWFDVEQCSGCWHSDLSANCEYITTAVKTASSMGVQVGVYASKSEWGLTVGSSCSGLSSYPLWYPHYDGQESFSDFTPFAGWTTPAIKQYNDKGPCTDVDVNWYP